MLNKIYIKMRKIYLFVLISLFSVVMSFGQDNFENSKVYVQYNKALEEFYDSNNKTLYTNLSNKPIVRFVPDFSLMKGGCIISIECDSLRDYKLYSHCYTLRSFLSRNCKNQIFEHSVIISQEFSSQVSKLFQFAIDQINNNEEIRYGYDGVNYYFICQDKNNKLIGAKIWSPDKKFVINDIIDVCNDLVSISKGRQNKIKKVNKKIDEILNTTPRFD